MVALFIGIGVLALILMSIYILGILPNLWSNCVISYSSFDDIMTRGLNILLGLIIIAAILVALHGIGMWIQISIK